MKWNLPFEIQKITQGMQFTSQNWPINYKDQELITLLIGKQKIITTTKLSQRLKYVQNFEKEKIYFQRSRRWDIIKSRNSKKRLYKQLYSAGNFCLIGRRRRRKIMFHAFYTV